MNNDITKSKFPIALMLVLASISFMIVGGPLTYAQQANDNEQNTVADVQQSQSVVTTSVEDTEDVPDGYNIRWSTIGTIEGDNGIGVLLAECLPGEIPLTPLYNLWENVGITQQLVIGLEDHLALLLVVQNYGDDKQAISTGVACYDEDGDDGDDGEDANINIDNSVYITNIVKNVVKNINKNITVIGNGTGGNGSIVIPPPPPPPPGGNNTGGGGNTTDPGTGGGGNTTDPGPGPINNTTETETEAPTGNNNTNETAVGFTEVDPDPLTGASQTPPPPATADTTTTPTPPPADDTTEEETTTTTPSESTEEEEESTESTTEEETTEEEEESTSPETTPVVEDDDGA